MLFGLLGKISLVTIASSAIVVPLIAVNSTQRGPVKLISDQDYKDNCQIVMTVTSESSDGYYDLLACRANNSSEGKTNFYLYKRDQKIEKIVSEEVKSFERETQELTKQKIKLSLYKGEGVETREMHLSQAGWWEKINNWELKNHCKVDWDGDKSSRRQITCSKDNVVHSEYLDRFAYQ